LSFILQHSRGTVSPRYCCYLTWTCKRWHLLDVDNSHWKLGCVFLS